MADANLATAASFRIFIQDGGINPTSSYNYQGCMMLGGPNQDFGAPDPIYCPSPSQPNKWDIVGVVGKSQSLGEADFTAHADRWLRDIWLDLAKRGCGFNMQAVTGVCKRPDDFSEWDAKLVFYQTRVTNVGLGDLSPLSGDDNTVLDWNGSFTYRTWDIIRRLKFAEKADSTVVAEVLDGFIYDVATCGECGTPSDGCNIIYLLTASNSGSPGLSSQLVYSLNGGSTWTGIDINTLGGKSANRAAAMGNKIVVVSQASGSHHYSPIASVKAGTQNWTEVTGYVSTKGPRAIYVKASNQAFIGAAGGYIYFLATPTGSPTVLTDGSITTQDLNDVNGYGQTIVAVGNNNALLVSSNNGDSFSLVTGPTVGVNLTSIWCVTDSVWFVGTGNGKLYTTINGGSSWTLIGLGAGVQTINDIRFENEVVGYLAAEVAGAASVFRTTDGGITWSNTTPELSSIPTAVRCNFVYPCGVNLVLTGGRKTVGGDGLVAIAE